MSTDADGANGPGTGMTAAERDRLLRSLRTSDGPLPATRLRVRALRPQVEAEPDLLAAAAGPWEVQLDLPLMLR